MKINDVKIGEEYAYEARWDRRRVRAVAVEQVTEKTYGGGPWSGSGTRQVRKVLIEVLDWDTGEPKPDDPKNGKHVGARVLQPFEPVRQRIEASERKAQDNSAFCHRVAAVLAAAGVDGAVVAVRPSGSVSINLATDEVEHLLSVLSEQGDDA